MAQICGGSIAGRPATCFQSTRAPGAHMTNRAPPCGSPKVKTFPASRILSVVIEGLWPANSNPGHSRVRRPQRLGRPGWDWGAAILLGIQHTLDQEGDSRPALIYAATV